MLNPKSSKEQLPLDLPFRQALRVYATRITVIMMVALSNIFALMLITVITLGTLAEILSVLISLSALGLSIAIAYRTFFSRFKVETYLMPRVKFSKLDKPLLIVGIEMVNPTGRSGSIDDLVLRLIRKGTTIGFVPEFVIDKFTDMETLSEIESFRPIVIRGNSSLFLYIAFKPIDDQLALGVGHYNLHLFIRYSGKPSWQKAKQDFRFYISEEVISAWETKESSSFVILEELFKQKEKQNFQ